MLNLEKQLNEFRNTIKNEIVNLIVDIYKSQYDELPNWEEEEEIVIYDDNLPTYRISVSVGDIYSSDDFSIEKWAINEYHVTLGDNLYFYCGDDNQKFHYSAVSTDELVEIWSLLKKSIKQ